MASTITRRPLPALVALLALLALTAIVWWRVINRDTDSSADASKKSTPATCSTQPVAAPTKTLAPPRVVTVRVLNSTDRSGIAAKARSDLLSAGFKIPIPADNDKGSVSITATAQIRYGKAGVGGARLLRYYFPGAILAPQKQNHTAIVTVSLGDAYKQVASAGQVRKAMAAQRITVGSTAASKSARSSPASANTASTTPASTASTTPAC